MKQGKTVPGVASEQARASARSASGEFIALGLAELKGWLPTVVNLRSETA